MQVRRNRSKIGIEKQRARDIHSWTHEKEKTSNALLYMVVVNADPHPSDTFGSNAKRRNQLTQEHFERRQS
jgi:hypothetical protein